MKTAVIIPTHKRGALFRRLLQGLEQAALPAGIEIHVIENGPRTGVAALCETSSLAGCLRYAYLAKGCKSTALNHAVEATTADLLIFFDDDIAVPPTIVETYTAAANRYGEGYFFGGPLIAESEIPCPAELAPYLPLSAKGWYPSAHETVVPRQDFAYFFGANWAVFRGDLAKAGLFREELGITASPYSPLGEENEIQERLLAASVKPVYLPDAVIRHPVPRECYTTGWTWRRRFRLGVTDWTRRQSIEQAHCRRLLGVPAWLLRAAAEQKIKAALSDVCGMPGRIDTRMRDAYLSGLLYGAWTTRKRRRRPRLRQGPAAC
jgi:GT2 family glycosyltransferase